MMIYAKTSKGGEEMVHRSNALGPKLRRLLILIDGKRPVDELKRLFGAEPVEEEIEQLATGGYIEAVAGSPMDEGLADGLDLSDLPDDRPADALPKAKNFIINTLTHFHGPYTKLDLMRATQNCHTHNELRELYPEWLRCMRESKGASSRLFELQKQLFAVL